MEKNPIPQGKYAPATKAGKLVYSAGMTPRLDGKLILTGKVTADQPLDFYKEAVVQAAKNAIVAIENALTDGEELEQILSMTVYVNAEDGYTLHSKIADFASDFLVDRLGERAVCSRAAIGVASLPGNAPVEIQLVVALQ